MKGSLKEEQKNISMEAPITISLLVQWISVLSVEYT